MRPAFSIIVFTVVSGAGYGLLFLFGLAIALGTPTLPYFAYPADSPSIAIDPLSRTGLVLAAGFLLTSAGLFASTSHLGKPLRAWRAFSQWRSSWLSREGIASLLTLVPLIAVAWLLFVRDPGSNGVLVRYCAAALALCSAATVYCTAHIYSCLKPVRAWHNGYVLPGYLLLGLHSGALWVIALGTVRFSAGVATPEAFAWLADAIVLAPACAWLKWNYWRWLDANGRWPDAGVATGLDRFGRTSSQEAPHTEENYLTHEMGFVLARKHSRRLRLIAVWLILLTPGATLLAAWTFGWAHVWSVSALTLGMIAIFIERWLFFAEARHAVIAYYGR